MVPEGDGDVWDDRGGGVREGGGVALGSGLFCATGVCKKKKVFTYRYKKNCLQQIDKIYIKDYVSLTGSDIQINCINIYFIYNKASSMGSNPANKSTESQKLLFSFFTKMVWNTINI